MKRRWLSRGAALLSGLLLWSAFPPLAQADAAWFALVPLLLVLRHATPRSGFRLAWLTGFLFWLGNLAWLWRLIENGGPLLLVLLGHVALAAYCALYCGLFGLTLAWLWQRQRLAASPWGRLLLVLLSAPLLWAGSELLRATLFTGFAWNSLAVSQYRNLALIQAAAWGGTPAVAALLVAVNGGIALLLQRSWYETVVRRRLVPAGTPAAVPPRYFPLRSLELTLALVLTVTLWWHGIARVRAIDRTSAAAPRWRLALFHPETPSIFEVDTTSLAESIKNFSDHAEIAAAVAPDLAIWPETMLPGPPPFDELTMQLVSNVTHTLGAPLLAGGLEIEPGPGWEWTIGARYYNAAFLFDRDGRPAATYRKQHLVPFGEYIPGDNWFPWLAKLSPIGYSCTAGSGALVMPVTSRSQPGQAPLKVAPLICFEDTLPYLARRAVRAGATLLVNQTNDAWFDGSSEAEQHLAQAVFRAVETGVPLVRSSNRGITAVILPNGRVVRRLGAGDGQGTPGLLCDETGVAPHPTPTLYLRYGAALVGLPGTILLLALLLPPALTRFATRRGKPGL